MKNNIAFSNTLEALKQRYQYANDQVVLIMEAQRALEDQAQSSEDKPRLLYEVYLPQYASDQSPVKTTGRTIHAAYKKAAAAWEKNNWRSELPEIPKAEVFVLVNNVHIAVFPEDASWIAKRYEQVRIPKGTFGISKRIGVFPGLFPGQMAFRPGDKFLSQFERSWLQLLNNLKMFGDNLGKKRTARKKS